MKIPEFKNSMKLFIVTVCLLTSLAIQYGRGYWYPYYLKLAGTRTLGEVINQYGSESTERLLPHFQKAGVAYPPDKVNLLAFKDSNVLELWVKSEGKSTLIRSYEILGASGVLGPKLREGDHQVPEGIYKITGFNPNSSYHLSMKLNYPNPFDWEQAKKEGRTQPGSNIFIHGKDLSVGCLAMGDAAIEELFVLIHKVGLNNAQIVISPADPNLAELVKPSGAAGWVDELYRSIQAKIDEVRQSAP